MLAGTSLDVDAELDSLERALTKELQGVPGPEIANAIKEARRDLGEPRITQFLPILIERRVRARLRG